MSHKDHEIEGEGLPSIIGLFDKVYLNHRLTLPCFSLTVEQAKHVVEGLQFWLKYKEGQDEKKDGQIS